jgi:serine/threonine-protein kinase PRP4
MASPASSDEGEIVEKGTGVGDSKATTSPRFDGTGVDRPDRNRARPSRSKSPADSVGTRDHDSSYGQRSRLSHSPAPRGSKRPLDDRDSHHHDRNHHDRNGRANADTRRFRVHYEDSRDDARRSHLSYDDDDRPRSRTSAPGLRYDDGEYPSHRERDRKRDQDRDWQRERHPQRDDNRNRDRYRDRERDRDGYPDKRARKRSNSPYRSPRHDPRDRDDYPKRNGSQHTPVPGRDQDRGTRNEHHDNSRHSQDHSNSHRGALADRSSRDNTGRTRGNGPERTSDQAKVAASPRNTAPEPEAEIVDTETEIERRRRRREELLAKPRGATPMLVQALQASERKALASPSDTRATTPIDTEVNTPRSGKHSTTYPSSPSTNIAQALSSPASPASAMPEGASPGTLHIANDQDLINKHGVPDVNDEDGPSAADYDPTVDMREDELRDVSRHNHIGPHGESLTHDEKADIAPSQPVEAGNKDPSTEQDDDFDMFAEDFDEDKFAAPKPVVQPNAVQDDRKLPSNLAQANGGGILEGDDKDGYYKIRIGELMNGRYQVQSTLGKGMFSGVARAVDVTNQKLVAVKMMRNNDALRKGGFTEIAILQKLNDADLDNKKHIVKFERHFEHKGHLCLAFENLSLNLREVLKKFGNNVGINLQATRAYAHQMFVGLGHMRKCSIIHADIKPDNILVNESRSVLKICDLGTAIDRSDAATAHNEITPYLVSRFYRAPEIILGMPYDYAIDMWSIGCTLYELYTGKILFTGDSNNQMLKAIIEIRGKFTPKLYRRGQLAQMHFDDMGNFVSIEHDKALGKVR